MKGRQAHGSTPHLGVDPIVTASGIVMALQTIRSRILSPLSENVVTVGYLPERRAPQHHPGVGRSSAARSAPSTTRRSRRSRRACATSSTAITKAAHATYELSFDTGHPMTVNDRRADGRLVPTLERLIGKDKVRDSRRRSPAPRTFRTSRSVVPGFYFRLGVVPDGKTSTRPPHAGLLRGGRVGADRDAPDDLAGRRLPGGRRALSRRNDACPSSSNASRTSPKGATSR